MDELAQLAPGAWPNQQRFPHNAGRGSVEDVFVADLRSDAWPLIFTGYASLGRLIDFLDDAGVQQLLGEGRLVACIIGVR